MSRSFFEDKGTKYRKQATMPLNIPREQNKQEAEADAIIYREWTETTRETLFIYNYQEVDAKESKHKLLILETTISGSTQIP